MGDEFAQSTTEEALFYTEFNPSGVECSSKRNCIEGYASSV